MSLLFRNNLKPMYGYILVDNLQSDVALESISLPATVTVKIGKTLTLILTFNPTNKIVTWSSSYTSVATENTTNWRKCCYNSCIDFNHGSIKSLIY